MAFHQPFDLEIDKLTRSIENAISGDSFKTEILEIAATDIYVGKEDQLQITCAYFLRMKYPELKWFHSPNGGNRNKDEARKFKAMGVSPGVPDILIPHPKNGYNGLAIELKVKPNTATDTQLEWLYYLRSIGWRCHIVHGITAFENLVKDYLK